MMEVLKEKYIKKGVKISTNIIFQLPEILNYTVSEYI